MSAADSIQDGANSPANQNTKVSDEKFSTPSDCLLKRNSVDPITAGTPTKRLKIQTTTNESNLSEGTQEAMPNQTKDKVSGDSTPVKHGPDSTLDEKHPKKYMKPQSAEKDLRRQQIEERKRQKEEEKRKKEEDKRKREEEKQQKEVERLKEKQRKELERRLREEEKQKILEEKRVKEEEKRQKDEERRIEKQKKEDERKQKEEEKEKQRLEKERELKKKEELQQRQQGILMNFFKRDKGVASGDAEDKEVDGVSLNPPTANEGSIFTTTVGNVGTDTNQLSEFDKWIFPFEVKAHVVLPPRIAAITEEDFRLGMEEPIKMGYLEELRARGPRGVRRITWHSGMDENTSDRLVGVAKPESSVTCIVVDDLTNTREDESKVQRLIHRQGGLKLIQCHDNYRPPFYGTHPRYNALIGRRAPFALVEGLNYDEDSDEDWEEEPVEGESLTEEEKDEEEEDKEDEDEQEDGFVVPHGYLSDDEGLDAEDGNADGADGADKETRKTEARIAEQQKKKMQPLKLIMIGCVWTGDVTVPDDMSAILQTFKATPLVKLPVEVCNPEPVVEEGEKGEGEGESASKRAKKKEFPEDLTGELLELVHGSLSAKEDIVERFKLMHPDLSKGIIRESISMLAEKKGRALWNAKEGLLEQYGIGPSPIALPPKPVPTKALKTPLVPAITSFFSSTVTKKE